MKCIPDSHQVCGKLQAESSYEAGTEIECQSNMQLHTCKHVVFTGSLKSVLCEGGNSQTDVNANKNLNPLMCENMTVHSTGDIPTNVTCRMGPQRWRKGGPYGGVCQHAQIRGVIG